MSQHTIGLHILRLGLAGVFLWFGFSQLFDTLSWVDGVPEWAISLLRIPPAMIVMANGLLEVVLGSLLALGFFVRISSLILGLHLLIIAVDFGFSPAGVRDAGLALATFALGFMYVKTPCNVRSNNSVDERN
jgi:uncharacterized membrane protein YphA (DoxX/SURF4 family)